jgi:hypothetical protein
VTLRYEDFKYDIDVDAFEEAIGFTPLTQDRGNDIGHCVFPDNHKTGDSTGKFAIERDERLYNCFVCGGGTLLHLVKELQSLTTQDATVWIYQYAHGDHKGDEEFADDLIEMLYDDGPEAKQMPVFNDRALDQFDGPIDYFINRGISKEVVRSYHLCYSDHVTKRAYTGPSSIWPHYWKGKLVGWQYRWHEYPDTPMAKWTNTMGFPKSTTLFNYDSALHSTEPIVVCESLGTVLFCATHDVHAVAYFGSKPNAEQLKLLRRFSQGIILAPDNDSNKAGDLILTAVFNLERYIPVQIADKVEGPDGADLGDYIQSKNPGAALKHHLKYQIHDADSLDF